MQKNIHGIIVECLGGNIAAQSDADAVVNAANAQLRIGGGVAGAIHRAAGPGLEIECRPLAPIKPGEAVITSGQGLPNAYCIHCLGPIYGRDKPETTLLTSCYRKALALAEKHEIKIIAFPAISAGAFGYPLEEAAKVALKTVIEEASQLQQVKKIRFVLYGLKSLEIHQKILSDLTSNS